MRQKNRDTERALAEFFGIWMGGMVKIADSIHLETAPPASIF